MKYTSNYLFKKPEDSDTLNKQDFNYNSDLIDATLKAQADNNNTMLINETARISAEEARVASGIAAQTAETNRVTAEGLRVTEFGEITNEYGVALHENVDVETVNARGGEVNLGARLTKHETALADNVQQLLLKAPQTSLDTTNNNIVTNTFDIENLKTQFGSLGSAITFKGSNTNANIIAIVTPSVGDCWYDTTNSQYIVYNGTVWSVGISNLAVGSRSINSGNIKENSITSYESDFIDNSVNLFDKSKDNLAGFYSGTGVFSASATLSASNKIPCKANDSIKFNYSLSFGAVTGNYSEGILLDKDGITVGIMASGAGKINGIVTEDKYWTFIAPVNTAYVRFNYKLSEIATVMCTINGSYPLLYVAYKTMLNSSIELPINFVNTPQYNYKSIIPSKTAFIKSATNMFDIDDIILGFYYSSISAETKSAMATGYISNKMPVNNGDVISFMFQPQFFTTSYGCLFDKNGVYIGSIHNGNVTFSDATSSATTVVNILDPTYVTHTIANVNVAYIELNIYTQYKPMFMCVKSSVYPKVYENYKYGFTYDVEKEEKRVIKESFKYLFNSCICIGDSLTEGNYGTGVGIKPKGYPYFLKKMANLEVVENCGISGANPTTWYASKGTFYDYALYDVAIIFLGTNGTMTDTVVADTTDGFATTDTGYYCKLVNDIKTENPNCKIFLVTRFANAGTSGNTNTNLAIKSIATKYECNVIDLYTYNFYKTNSLWHPNDGVHFGKVGYLMLTNEIVKQMTELMYNNQLVFNDNN